MNKTVLFGMLFATVCVFVACEKNDPSEDKGESYTSTDQKVKLENIATKLVNKFNTQDQKKVVELSDYLTDLYDTYNWDFSEVENHYKGKFGFLRNVNKYVHSVAKGDVTANLGADIMSLVVDGTSDTEIYNFSTFDGVWEANDATHTWEYKEPGNGGVVLKFKGPNGSQCIAKLQGSGAGQITYPGTYEAPNGKYYIIPESEMQISDGESYYYNGYSYSYYYSGEYYQVQAKYTDYYYIDAYAYNNVTYSWEAVEIPDGEYYYNFNQYYYYQNSSYEVYKGNKVDYYYILLPEDKVYVTESDYNNGYYMYNNKQYWVSREYANQPFEATLPAKITFSLKEETVEHISMEMNFDIKKSDHFNYDSKIKITNLTYGMSTKISKNAIGTAFYINLGSEQLIKAVTDLKNCILIDKAESQDWGEFAEMYAQMFDELDIATGTAVASIDVLGELQIKATTTDGTKFLQDLRDLEDKYPYDSSNHWWEQADEQPQYNTELAKLYNSFLTANLYYNGNSAIQAQLKSEVVWRNENVYIYDNDYNYTTEQHQLWDCEPVFYFPKDGTSYAFGDYFTEGSFKSVINLTEDLVNNYIKLSQHWSGEIGEIKF